METVLVRYAEIGLKGGNRYVFEDQLIKNIKLALKNPSLQIIKLQKQILVSGDTIDLNKLKTVFGIAWLALTIESADDLQSIIKAALSLVKPHKTFAVRAHHGLEVSLGDIIRVKKKIKVDLDNPQQTIYVSGNEDRVFVFNQKISGPGGLPVGTSGKVLCLLSGGFDSVAAAYLLAKRGAQVDFLHFHIFPDRKTELTKKIQTLAAGLKNFTFSRRLFLVSYLPFQMAALAIDRREEKQELVVYRRLMVQVGEILARKFDYQALVLGDSLGQVASQTMENIVAVDNAVALPVFRPLIGMDKKDIINLVKAIGLEEVTNLPYKDCCSLISTHPATLANSPKIHNLEKKIKIEKIIQEISDNAQIVNL